MKSSRQEDQPLQPLKEFPRENIHSPSGITGIRVNYSNPEGQNYAVDVTSANHERVAAYIDMAQLYCQGRSIDASERTPSQTPDGGDALDSTLEQAMADVLYYGKHAFLFSDSLAQLIEESGQSFPDLLRKIGEYDLKKHARLREQSASRPQDFESLERDIRSILEQQLQADDELEDPDALNITLDWLDAPEGIQRVEFVIDPTVTFFLWNDNAVPRYDINAVDSYWKFGATFVSASISTSGGSVDATILRNGCVKSGPGAAPTSVSHSSTKNGDYRLRIRGTSHDPNTYSVTGTWEA